MFLLGDAAHLTPPFIGQGMGAGLRDAMNLSWKLAGVVNRELPASVLDSYERERKPHALAMIRLALMVGRAMTAGGRLGALARRLVVPRIQLIPGLRARILNSATPRLKVGRGRLAGRLSPVAVGAGFTVISGRPLSQADRARAHDRRADVVIATEWLGHSKAAVVRPDFTVLRAGRNISALLDTLPDLHTPAQQIPQPPPAH